ncbi:MAG: TRAP transporter small permease subunit [Alphaproteobacteria bacterium]|nr:TRAP transporter small permease subunit [Alphaproteobacteria bacterium]MBO6862219.1 TRAP transporter small permease subunit [Alphaproteobacteria bacterium]MEC9267679.1 TRAP transporter small permease subunit [Pseudomonadota bacterium]
MIHSSDTTADLQNGIDASGSNTWLLRAFGWAIVLSVFVYVINNYLNVWWEWPGAMPFYGLIGLADGARNVPTDGAGITKTVAQFLAYAVVAVLAFVACLKTSSRALRADANILSGITNYIIRAAFWAVLLIGLADAFISYLRVEGMLSTFVGDTMTTELGRSRFRGPYVHFPLIIASLIIAAKVKDLGFHWLGLLIVAAELLIVVTRFVFSYEQAYQGDLVRFWYGALFLFASAYTLFDDGHVRVDVFYSGFPERLKGMVNAGGALFMGIALCWTILIFGMWDKSSIINAPLANYEVSQSGFGMYVKFWMAGFLGIFAVTMAVQFVSLMFEGLADWRGDPGKREVSQAGAH